MVNVSLDVYAVPDPSALVFQPVKTAGDLVSVPVLPNTVRSEEHTS